MTFLLGVFRTVLWPLILPVLKEFFDNYFKDHEYASRVDSAAFQALEAKTPEEKKLASKALFKALKR